jgi:hypothetical protein
MVPTAGDLLTPGRVPRGRATGSECRARRGSRPGRGRCKARRRNRSRRTRESRQPPLAASASGHAGTVALRVLPASTRAAVVAERRPVLDAPRASVPDARGSLVPWQMITRLALAEQPERRGSTTLQRLRMTVTRIDSPGGLGVVSGPRMAVAGRSQPQAFLSCRHARTRSSCV